jgi:hypothetical protein
MMTGPDLNEDGIVDNPYAIDGSENYEDAYPLTEPIFRSQCLAAPVLLFPTGGEVLTGSVTIQWEAAIDYFGHEINYTILISRDNGSTWSVLVTDLQSTSYVWDTSIYLSQTGWLLKIVATCADGVTTEAIMDSSFDINNAIIIPTTPTIPTTEPIIPTTLTKTIPTYIPPTPKRRAPAISWYLTLLILTGITVMFRKYRSRENY